MSRYQYSFTETIVNVIGVSEMGLKTNANFPQKMIDLETEYSTFKGKKASSITNGGRRAVPP